MRPPLRHSSCDQGVKDGTAAKEIARAVMESLGVIPGPELHCLKVCQHGGAKQLFNLLGGRLRTERHSSHRRVELSQCMHANTTLAFTVDHASEPGATCRMVPMLANKGSHQDGSIKQQLQDKRLRILSSRMDSKS